jgi:hypothetical protein
MSQVKLLLSFSCIFAVIIFMSRNIIVSKIVTEYKPFSADFGGTKHVKSHNKKSANDSKIRIQKLFHERTERIRTVCSEENSRIPATVKIYTGLIWSIEKKHKLLMCRTAKHGSTTWASIFVQIYTNG